ncbi:MAG: Cache 3/Cache 2 fusion domain-containing protein [Spirochaetes bacterium]|nr:Cache 3/Cache 2 fusion domain-containing protein [Spirochaetota bacterium]
MKKEKKIKKKEEINSNVNKTVKGKVKDKKSAKKSHLKLKSKKSIVGFRGRLSFGFFLIVVLFTLILFLFIYLNRRVSSLREESDIISNFIYSWERIINSTNKLLISNVDVGMMTWVPQIDKFDKELNEYIDKNIKKYETAEEKNIIIKTINKLPENIMLFLSQNILNKTISSQEEIYNKFKGLKYAWGDGSERDQLYWLIKNIQIEYNEESFQNIIKEEYRISVLQLYAEWSLQDKYDFHFSKFIEHIQISFPERSATFSEFLKGAVDMINNNVSIQISVLNYIMATITTIFAILSAFFIIFFFIYLKQSLVDPLLNLINETSRINKGDLTRSFEIKRRDEIGELTNAFNTTVTDLKNSIQQIYLTVIVIIKTFKTLFKSSKVVKESATAQSLTIEQILGNFEKLDNMVKTITDEALRANQYSIQALNKARVGMETIQNLEREMSIIETSSLEITEIIKLINEIAEQTELLSLNASIESARSGEAGRGFNVVAREVSKLAEKSTQSANKIYDLITRNNNIIKSGVKYSKEATKALEDIALSNELSAGIVKTISEEIQKVKQSSNEIFGVINYIFEVTNANLLESEKVSKAIDDLGNQISGLQKFVKNFDVRSENIKSDQNQIEVLLKAKVKDLENYIEEMGGSILPSGDIIKINIEDSGVEEINELKLGDIKITSNDEFASVISKRTNCSASFYQRVGEKFVCVSSNLQNYDNTTIVGTQITNEDIINKLLKGEIYLGRNFIISRWYVTIYDPIIDESGYVIGVLFLGIPEKIDFVDTSSYSYIQLEEDLMELDTGFRHSY